MFVSLKRVIKFGFVNFWRQGGLTFATCFILVTAISLIAFLFSLRQITDLAIQDLQNKVNISVYFQKDASEEDILNLKNRLAEIPQVKSVDYISKEEALVTFMDRHENDAVLIESIAEIGDNPLLASLSIKSWQIDQYEEISQFLTGIDPDDFIEKVDYYQRKPLIERFASVASGVKTAGLAASIILSIVAMLITFNTIRLAIFSQKEEISIQRLVGASNWFIRGPFLTQGIMAGILSALVSFAIFFVFFWLLSPRVANLFSDVNLFRLFISNAKTLILIQITAGILLGVFSSFLAVRRYLKV